MNIEIKLVNIYWWIMHRFHPKHRYNIIKLPLKLSYYDWNIRIIYATFELFCEWKKIQR